MDPERRDVEGWTPDAALPWVEWEFVRWQPAGPAEPLRLTLQELFGPI